MDNLPQDPFILFGFINMQLRDNYQNLDELCASLDISREDIESRLAEHGFVYDAVNNRFY